jgi:hypothetical protein
MSLRVDPYALRGCAFALGRAADAATVARAYAARHGDLAWDEVGLLATARFVHGDFVDSLTATLRHLHDLLHDGQTELHRAAGWYEKADAAAAARADALYTT